MCFNPLSFRRLILIVALAAALSLPWLERPFHTRGEPREALVAQAMLLTGNWISPPAYDGAVPSKPPFSHWLIALASLPLGEVSEASSRLPSALAFIVFSAAFFCFLEKRLPLRAATGAELILLSSSEWFRSASTCRVDTLLATSMSGALICLYSWWEREYRGVPWLALILTVCAALTKGPVGIILPLGLFSFFCWTRSGLKISALPSIVLRATALAIPVVAIASIWYLLGYLERGDAFIEKIRYENFERFTSSMVDEPHKHSVFYLFGMLLLGLLPWSLFIVWALPFCRALKQYKGFVNLRSWWQSQSSLYQFASIAALGIVLFFCVPSSKRSVYLLPAYPFLAIIIERGLRSLEERSRGVLARISSCIVWGIVLLLLAGSLLYIVPIAQIKLDPQAFLQSMTLGKVISGSLLLGLFLLFLRSTVIEVLGLPIQRLGLFTVSAVVVISFFIYDTVAWQLSPKRLVSDPNLERAIKETVRANSAAKLLSYGSEAYGASFYLKLPFSRATAGDVFDGSLVFLEAGKLAEFREKIAPDLTEIARYSSGVEGAKRDMLVVRIGSGDIEP
jgi:4-amino-4-deoxy-L-arabinose transferase-like glycosyltransferase